MRAFQVSAYRACIVACRLFAWVMGPLGQIHDNPLKSETTQQIPPNLKHPETQSPATL